MKLPTILSIQGEGGEDMHDRGRVHHTGKVDQSKENVYRYFKSNLSLGT